MLRPAGARADRGFTLIEITASVLLIALMLSVTIVRLDRRIPRTRSEAAAREFLATYDLARTSAVAKGMRYEIEIDIEGSRYRIVTPLDQHGTIARSPEERSALNWNELEGGVYFSGIYDAAGQFQENGTYRLPFSPMGSTQELYVYLDNEEGDVFGVTVRIFALTGSSKVMNGRVAPTIVTENDF